MTVAAALPDVREPVRAGAVTVARPDLAVLPLSGADVLEYLHKVSSQHTAGLRPGQGACALLLSPKGKIEFSFRLGVTPDLVWLDTDVGAAPALAERLSRFLFRHDVAIGEPVAGVLSVVGPAADEVLSGAGLAVPADGASAAGGAGLMVHRTRLGADLVGRGVPAASAALRSAGVAEAAPALWETLRVEQGEPRWGLELTDDVLAEEAGLLGTHVHLDKGCYPGQETVARVHNLGQVQRRLAGLRVDGDPPALRTELRTAEGRRAGVVRSSLWHPDLGAIALAYVRRASVAGATLFAGDAPARVVDLPFRKLWAPQAVV